MKDIDANNPMAIKVLAPFQWNILSIEPVVVKTKEVKNNTLIKIPLFFM